LRVAANNKVDSGKLSPFMKQYLKASVASGELVQTKSKGATGSLRLATTKLEE
jgi:histone H1/5